MPTSVFKVEMTCGGCESAVKKVLEKYKAKGIDGYSIKLDEKEVTVKGSISAEDAKAIIAKTGRNVELIKSE